MRRLALCAAVASLAFSVGAAEKRPPAKVEFMPMNYTSVAGGCPCGSSLVCVGPKGGRYCISGKGKKKYL